MPPRRFAFVYTPNGYLQETFIPSSTGRDWSLPPALQPLAPLQSEITLLSGLDRAFVPGTGVHAQCGSCWLTSSPPTETLDGGFPTNTTLDQLLAAKASEATFLPSLELSCNDFPDRKETRYFECISWLGPGCPAATEKDPAAVFRRLFHPSNADPIQASILDAVREAARALERQLGRADREKLEEYLESVRTTERRIQRAAERPEPVRPPGPEPGGIPEHRGEYIQLMLELITLAFQQDLTRVATLIIDPERWDSPRRFHGVFDTPQNHHVLTHTKGPEAKVKLTAIDRFHVAQFARWVKRLREIVEVDGTLLDHSTVVMGSGISDGDRHNYQDLQVLLAGRGGGAFRPIGHHAYAGHRPLADLWLTLARAGGLEVDRIADSTGILPEILA